MKTSVDLIQIGQNNQVSNGKGLSGKDEQVGSELFAQSVICPEGM
jgi:hypothetical protein